MSCRETSPFQTYRPRYACVALAVALGAQLLALPAFASSSVPAVLPAVGKTMHYRITRTAQGNTGLRTALSNLTLRRKSATTLTLVGLYDRPGETSVLAVGTDGALQIAPSDKPAKDDASLTDILNGLNRLTAIFAGQANIPHDGWSAKLRLPEVRGTTAPIVIPIAVENASASDFELHGVGMLSVEAVPGRNEMAGPRNFGPRGYRGIGAFAGGPLPGEPNVPGSTAAGRPAFSVALSVDGRVRHGTVGKISIVETRSTTVDALPYVNVSGWTIETLK